MAMLQGIQGANNVQEKEFGGNLFAPLPANGYVCKILAVKVESTSGGSQYIKLRIDVAEGEYAGYFQKRFSADASSQYGQKWKGIHKIFLPKFNGDNGKYTDDIATYKGNLNTIARANNLPEPNIEAGFDPDIFKGCTVGVLYREASYRGKKFTESAYLRDPQKIRSGDFEIPAPRLESAPQSAGMPSAPFAAPAQSAGGVFAAANQQAQPPAFQQPVPATQAAPQTPQLGDLSDFEEIVTNGDVPF